MKLRKEVADALAMQGYCLHAGEFVLPDGARDTLRDAHQMARAERIARCRDFIHDIALWRSSICRMAGH